MKLLSWIIVAGCLSGIGFAQNDGRATAHIFPQVADGHLRDGTFYRSALHITNPSATASGTCTVRFRGLTTTLQDVEGGLVTAGNFAITFPGNSWGIFRTGGIAAFQSGYATVACTIPVNAALIYSYYAATGAKLSEATVLSSPAGTLLQIISDQRDGARLGIAMTNDTDFAADVTVSASNPQGQGIGSAAIALPPRSQSVRFLDELVTGLSKEYLGQVLVRSSGPQLAVVGFRYTGSAFTTVPASVRQSAVIEPPTLASITPTSIAADSTVAVALSGTNFLSGSTSISVSGAGITVSGIQVLSPTSASAIFAISSNAAAGLRSVIVSTPGGPSGALNISVSAPTKPFNQSQTERLIGTWVLSYTIGSTPFSQTYRLSNVQPDTSTPGEWVIFGTDQFGDLVTAGYSARLATFALLDTSSPFDRLFAFDFTGADMVSGCYYQMPTGTTSLSSCYSMNGIRTPASTPAAAPDSSNADRLNLEVEAVRKSGPARDTPSGAFVELLKNLRNKSVTN